MTSDDSGIQWNPKVSQAKIRRLYENDARGVIDDDLIDEVGFILYGRCQSILIVQDHGVQCPSCGHIFPTGWQWHKRYDAMVIRCPACEQWEISGRQYRESLQRDNVGAGNALAAFQEFVERYPRTAAPRERMGLIDRLIHQFHYALSRMPDGSLGRNAAPHETTANNLIEGGHDQVVAFLDKLTYGEVSRPELHTTRMEWRARALEMKRRRSPQREGDHGSTS